MSRRLKIALADCDDGTRINIERWLKELGHEVCTVTDGWPLVNQCRMSLPDLVICDVHLPDMDGITAVKHILRDSPVPAVLMAVSWDAAMLQRAAALGVMCLVKPFSSLNLVNAVETACRAILAEPNPETLLRGPTRLHLAFGT